MKLRLIAATCALLGCAVAFAAKTMSSSDPFAKPDFAFPKTVSKNASSQLASALKTGNDREAVRALMNYTLAETAVDSKLAPDMYLKMQETEQKLRGPYKIVAALLRAELLEQVYGADQYRYDRRDAVTSTAIKNLDEWTGRQFTDTIGAIYRNALSLASQAGNIPLDQFRGIIDADRNALSYFPMLYDFAAYAAYEFYEDDNFHDNATRAACAEIVKKMVSSSTPASRIWWRMRELDMEQRKILVESSRRINALRELYSANEESEYSGDVLIEISDLILSGDMDRAKWLYGAVKKNMSRYSAYYRKGCLENIVKRLSLPGVSVTSSVTVYPGGVLPVKVSLSNLEQCRLEIMGVPDTYPLESGGSYDPSRDGKLVKKGEIAVSVGPRAVPFAVDTVVNVTFADAGRYVIRAVTDNASIDRDRFRHDSPMVYCTALAPFVQRSEASGHLYAVDAATGAPLKDVGVMLTAYRKLQKKLGTTDKEGELILPGDVSGHIHLSDSKSKFSYPLYVYGNYTGGDKDKLQYSINVFTSLGLYHPGDSVEWSAMVGSADKVTASPLAGERLRVRAVDANYDEIFADTLITDSWGRVQGCFVLPKDRLTGEYQLMLSVVDNNKRCNGATSFTVSDYKLPTFRITLDTPVKLENGSMRISGVAMGYNGFPVVDGDVTVSVGNMAWHPWRFYDTTAPSIAVLSATTDSNGYFAVELTDSVMNSAPYPAGIFEASVGVVSAGGETETDKTRFQNKKNCAIDAAPMQVIEASSPVKLDFRVVDIEMKPISVTVAYKIKSDDNTVGEGSFESDNPVIDLSGVPVGTYSVEFSVPSMPEAETVVWSGVAIYRVGENLSPSSKPLWIPVVSVSATASGKGSFTYATPEGKGWVLYTLYSASSADNRIISRRWIEVGAGLHKMDFTLPSGVDNAVASLVSVRDFVTTTVDINIKRADSAKGLKINIAGMRDRTEPLNGERWYITLTDLQGRPVEGAVMLDMWSAALGRLGGDPHWGFYVNRPQPFRIGYITSNARDNYWLYGNSASLKYDDCVGFVYPSFELWNRRWAGYGEILNTVRLTSTSMPRAAYGMAMDAIGSVDELKMSKVTPHAGSIEVEEAAMDDADGGSAPQKKVSQSNYRPSEIPLAFFRPMLTTDSKGQLHFSFTMPDAVTEWKVNALAFTRELYSDMVDASIIASKPLMVNPNVPRFVRTGDDVVIRTVTMNASDSALDVNTISELIDVATGRVLVADSLRTLIEKGSQSVSQLSFKVPSDVAMLRFRVRGTTDGFSDGEQSVIPVLPSISDVIESEPFYLTPDSLTFTMRLPAIPDGAKVNLQYCDNPLWTVITALPGISRNKPTTSPEAAANIFSAAVASKIVRENPAIVKAIREWINSGAGDSSLVSMLERNPELKQLALTSTPWVRDARSDSERMMRLALLLDQRNISKSVDEAVDVLSNLYVSSTGGWRWISYGDDASEWATMQVLSLMGMLNESSIMPDNGKLTKMVNASLKYIDRIVAREATKYPKRTFEAYTLMRDRFATPAVSSAAAVAVNRTVQRLVTGWKSLAPVSKAEAALILHRHGYRNVAAQAVESLDQYALSSPVKGMWWDGVSVGGAARILSAYASCGAGRHKVDMIRQWLIWQKEAQNWGDCAGATMAVSSILTTSRTWMRPAGTVSVTLGGKPVVPAHADYGSGYFSTPLSGNDLSGALLTIRRSGSAPAWGGVTFSYNSPMDSVKAAAVDELKVQKRLFKGVASASGMNWVECDTVAVGDRVRVVLTLNVTRTMDYVTIVDERPAGLEPIEQLPAPVVSEGIYFYRENRDSDTRMFVDRLPEGTYQISYELSANNCGWFSSGIATVQSQLNTTMTAHSAGAVLTINP